MFAEAIETILRDHCTPAAVRHIEAGGSPLPLWQALEHAGFLELLAPEDHGGAGIQLSDLRPVLEQFGRHAMPVPAAQAIVARAVLPPGSAPDGLLTLAPHLTRLADGGLACPRVPYGQMAAHVLGADSQGWVLLDASSAERSDGDIPGLQAASLRWADDAAVVQSGPGRAAELESLGAALHAALITGALGQAFEMTLQHCNDRVQFGRSLGQFQAVQHQLAVMAEHIAAASSATQVAFSGDGVSPHPMAAAMAKARTSAAAAVVAATAHALHGAIGVTADYDLQLHTRRLHAWRMAHGSESFWHRRIGAAVLASNQPLSRFVHEI
jgi:alkylation response protein AidB-like acyl-CoA dehydrogenase